MNKLRTRKEIMAEIRNWRKQYIDFIDKNWVNGYIQALEWVIKKRFWASEAHTKKIVFYVGKGKNKKRKSFVAR
jgi:hypothetical protein